MLRKISAGFPPYSQRSLLSDGPMPPPPFGAWQPTQLKLIKSFMPRIAASESEASGFFMLGPNGIAPGIRCETGAFISGFAYFPSSCRGGWTSAPNAKAVGSRKAIAATDLRMGLHLGSYGCDAPGGVGCGG